jgi:osmotically-inducible protein OsmY
MKTITTLVCAAALVAGCSHEKHTTRTAYDSTRDERTSTTVRKVDNDRPSRDLADERDRTVSPDREHYAGEGASDPLQVAPATPGVTIADEPDNTRVNRRDRDLDTMTPMDQGASDGDRAITAEIRKAVVNDGTLSFTAKNVKIITKDGNVVLRGPVKSEDERASILAKANRVAGPSRVTNQLEVAK